MAWLKEYLSENKGVNTTGLWDPDGPEESSSSSTADDGSSSSADDESSSSSTVGSSSASVDNSSSSVKDKPASSSGNSVASSSSSGKKPDVDKQSSSSATSTDVLGNNLHFGSVNLTTYDVYDLKGQKLVRFVAHNMEEVAQMWKNWSKNASKVQGIVMIRNRCSGETVQIKSVR